MYNMSRVTTHTLSRLSPLNPATRPTEGHWTEDAGSNFGEALRAFGERDEVKEAGGTLAVATVAATVAEPISAATSWACGKCTSVNEASATACNLCSSPHASAPPPTCTDCEDGPSTHHCAEEKEAEADLQPGELSCAPFLTAMVIHLRHEALYHPTYNGTAHTNSPPCKR